MPPNDSTASLNSLPQSPTCFDGPILDKCNPYSTDISRDMSDNRPRGKSRNLRIRIPSSSTSSEESDELQRIDQNLYLTIDSPASPAISPASPAIPYVEEVLTPIPCETESACSPLARKSLTRSNSIGPVVPSLNSTRKRKTDSIDDATEACKRKFQPSVHNDELSLAEIEITADFATDFESTEQHSFLNDLVNEEEFIRSDENSPWVIDTKTHERHYCMVFDMRLQRNWSYRERLSPYFFLDRSHAILQLHKVIMDDSNHRVLAVFEDFNGGDLHAHIRQKKRIKEDEARELLRPVFETIAECHRKKFYLRRIKLRNLVFLDREKTQLVLKNLEEGVSAEHQAGNNIVNDEPETNVYTAPEIFRTTNEVQSPNDAPTSYDGAAADVWAAGVVLFATLAGRYHISSRTAANKRLPVHFRTQFEFPRSSPLSTNAQNLLTSMLTSEPGNRIDMESVLNHPWFTHSFKSNPRPSPREMRTDKPDTGSQTSLRQRSKQRRVPVHNDDQQVPSYSSVINQSPIL